MGFAQPSPAFPNAPRRSLACSLAFLGARQCSSRSSDAFLSALPCSPALPGAPWRSLALPGGRPGPLPPRDPPPPRVALGGTTGGLRPRLRHDAKSKRKRKRTRKARRAEAKGNGEKNGSESEEGKTSRTRRTGRRIFKLKRNMFISSFCILIRIKFLFK